MQHVLKRDQELKQAAQRPPESAANLPRPLRPANPAPGAGGQCSNPQRTGPFQLLGVNVGADDTGNTTFTGKGRFFAPMGQNAAFQAQGEYLYFKTQREGQFDFGLVDRMSNVQAGLFASFKHVTLAGNQSGGTLGQAAFTVDYIFKSGKSGSSAPRASWITR